MGDKQKSLIEILLAMTTIFDCFFFHCRTGVVADC